MFNLTFFASLPMMVCAMWTVVLALDYLRLRSAVHLRLCVFLLAATLLYGGHYVFFLHDVSLIPLTDTVYVCCNLIVYPLYLIYIVQLTDGHADRRQWLLLLPAAVMGVVIGVLYVLMDKAQTQLFIHHYLYESSVAELSGLALWQAYAHGFGKVLFLLSVAVSCWLGYRHLHRFVLRILAFYADPEGRTLKPVRITLTLLLFTSLVSVVFGIIGRHLFDEVPWLSVPSLVFSSLLFAIAYMGHLPIFSCADLERDMQPAAEPPAELPLPEVPVEVPRPAEEPEPDAVPSKIVLVAEEIRVLMERDQLFLKNDLRLNDLAQQLGTNGKYVSMAVNTHFGCSFSEYINNLRIAYARQLMKDNPKMTIVEVAHKSGYTSMASFYRNLKSRVE
ncbi:MAG: AraC family transcriptional regulator [Prevotella sp.]|nr:AraC family transcriptional regulator [Prevotella sp.]